MNTIFQNSISFQKKLIAQGGYLKSGKSETCLIYELECGKDKKYMQEINNAADWKHATYNDNIGYYLSERFSKYDKSKIFAIEDTKENCLAFAMLDKFDDSYDTSMIEVAPSASSNNKRRTKKYIGETFLNFLAQYTLKENVPLFKIISPTKKARPFYVEKCFFEPATLPCQLSLDKKAAQRLNIQNELHTGKNIEFII